MQDPKSVWQILVNELRAAYFDSLQSVWELLLEISLLDFLRITPTSFPFTEGFWEALGILSTGLETFSSRLRQIPARIALSLVRDRLPEFGKGRSRALSVSRAYNACLSAVGRAFLEDLADPSQKQEALKSLYSAQRVGQGTSDFLKGRIFTKGIEARIRGRITGLAIRGGFAISQAILTLWSLAQAGIMAAVLWRLSSTLKKELIDAAFSQSAPRQKIRLAGRRGTIYRRTPGGSPP